MSENFQQLIEGAFVQKPVYPGAVVTATVLEIGKKDVLVDAQLKSESFIPTEQFIKAGSADNELEIEVGSEVDVVIEALEDGFGQTLLSREKAKRAVAWAELQTAFDNRDTIRGLVTGRVKGGFTVDMGILQGFLPGSQVDIQPVDTSLIEGKELEFKVIKLDFRRNNIVLSRRAALEFAGKAAREKRLNELYVGQVLEASVKNLTEYGAFMHLGDGIDALLHNVDLAWEKIKHPSQVLKAVEGQEDKPITLDVMILKIDRSSERPRISVGRKQLLQDPWVKLLENYAVGMRLEKRKITHIKEYGCFVEIEPGVEGLVHISEMDWTNRNPNPHTLIQRVQDEEGRVDVVILDIDLDLEKNRRRISLGMKQCTENPWENFAQNHHKGQYIKGKIRSITDLGLFISLEGHIDGLVHHSEISDNVSGEAAVRQFKKGEEVEVSILSIDPTRERVALSMRRSTADTNDEPAEENEIKTTTTLSDLMPVEPRKKSASEKKATTEATHTVTEEVANNESDESATSSESSDESDINTDAADESDITSDESDDMMEAEASKDEEDNSSPELSEEAEDVVDVEHTVELDDTELNPATETASSDEDADELANIEHADLPDTLVDAEPSEAEITSNELASDADEETESTDESYSETDESNIDMDDTVETTLSEADTLDTEEESDDVEAEDSTIDATDDAEADDNTDFAAEESDDVTEADDTEEMPATEEDTATEEDEAVDATDAEESDLSEDSEENETIL